LTEKTLKRREKTKMSDLILPSMFAPPILFFILGMVTIFVRSDLEIPPEVTKFLSIFLLLSIGLEGGIEGIEALGVRPDLLGAMAMVAIFGVILSLLTAVFSAKVFKSFVGFKTSDAWATAGLYSAVSSVTLLAAVGMANAAQEAAPDQLIYGDWMVAANVFLDAPGVIAAIFFGRMALMREGIGKGVVQDKRELFRDAVFGWAIWLMLCGLLVGILGQSFSPRRMDSAMEFFDNMFAGMLCLYMLEMGMLAAKRIGELREYGTKLVRAIPVAFILPQVWAIAAALGMYGINLIFPGLLGWGDAFVFVAMAGSASYISAPPAMRIAIPEANPSVYLPMALALTFPFNILVSLPIWLMLCTALWGTL
jgi:hypothetical protein